MLNWIPPPFFSCRESDACMNTPDFDDEFERAVGVWRQRHRLREDDAVLLLVELFRIHQRHWDDIRHRELPSFDQYRGDITRLCEASRTFQKYAVALSAQLKNLPGCGKAAMVTLPAAWLAALAGGLAGYLLGRAWP